MNFYSKTFINGYNHILENTRASFNREKYSEEIYKMLLSIENYTSKLFRGISTISLTFTLDPSFNVHVCWISIDFIRYSAVNLNIV